MRRPLALLSALLLLLAAGAALAAKIRVVVDQTTIRSRAHFLAPSAGVARRGEEFEASGPSAGWYKIPGGFIAQSAADVKKFRIGGGSSVGGGASDAEITAAAKGFNADVERKYRGDNPGANFAAVDALERRQVSDDKLRAFAVSGGLGGEEAR